MIKKTNLRLKGCLGKSKKSLSCEIPREVNTVENKTQHLPFGHFLKSIYVLSQNSHKKTWSTLTVVINLVKYF